jgi:ZIP family zinc transporter
MPLWVQAGLWGLLAGAALLVGAYMGYYWKLPVRAIAAIMAFGSGVLISALAFDLMDEAYKKGGIKSASIGFISGALIFTLINYYLSSKGAKHRKRSGNQQPSESQNEGSGIAIAAGALIDGIPESVVIGLSMLEGGVVSTVAVIAIFLSNLPEGLSSAAGMKNSGRSVFYVFGVWGTIVLISGLAALAGYTIFRNFSQSFISSSIAFAAGAILAMIVDTMIPEAFEKTHNFAGLITVAGFLAAFFLTKIQ